jgi:hypothetical protein
MAVITGVTGSVAVANNFSTLIINVNRFTLSIPSDMFEAGVFGAVTHTIPMYRGLYEVTGMIYGFFPRTVGVTGTWIQVGAAASTLTLTASTSAGSRTYIGPAHLDFSYTEDRVGGPVAYEAAFKSDGDWAFA